MYRTWFFCDCFFCFCLQLQLRDQYVGCGACRQRPSLQIRSLAGSAPGNTAVAADTKERRCLRLCNVKLLYCVFDAHIAVNFTLTLLLLTHRETHLHKSKCTEEKLQIWGSFTFSQKAELEVAWLCSKYLWVKQKHRIQSVRHHRPDYISPQLLILTALAY